jgi:hypothetical protein
LSQRTPLLFGTSSAARLSATFFSSFNSLAISGGRGVRGPDFFCESPFVLHIWGLRALKPDYRPPPGPIGNR